jgi:hypothetical protein
MTLRDVEDHLPSRLYSQHVEHLRISLPRFLVVDIVHGENVHKITPYRVQNQMSSVTYFRPLLTAFWIGGHV